MIFILELYTFDTDRELEYIQFCGIVIRCQNKYVFEKLFYVGLFFKVFPLVLGLFGAFTSCKDCHCGGS